MEEESIAITFTPQEWEAIRDYLNGGHSELIKIEYYDMAELKEKFKPFGAKLAHIKELADRIDAHLTSESNL